MALNLVRNRQKSCLNAVLSRYLPIISWLFWLFAVSNGQMPLQNTGYEGFAHYMNYDDYVDDTPTAKVDPYSSMRGSERVWNEEMMYIPELLLEDPLPREGTSPLPTGIQPWGGTKRGMVFYSAYPGRSNLIRWKVLHPIVDGNCTIRLSNGLDDKNQLSYQTLLPVFDFSYQNEDGSFDYFAGETGNYYRQFYEKGKFSCGRVDPGTFESITVQFPNMTCDDCTFQLIVETKQGSIYQCADIEIINQEMNECKGTCLNEGVCVNGHCMCRSGFLGDHCQTQTKEKRYYTSWWVIIGLILLAVIVAVVCYISLQFISQKEKWVSKFNRPRKSKHYPDSGLAL